MKTLTKQHRRNIAKSRTNWKVRQPENIFQIQQLKSQGFKSYEIGNIYNCSGKTINRVLKEIQNR